MKTLIATDAAIEQYNGRYYYESQVSSIMKRYYDAFGELTICCRVEQIDHVTSSMEDVTDIFEDVISLSSQIKTLLGLNGKKLRDAVAQCDLVICRCGGIIPVRAADHARTLKKPYLAEAMSCSWDAYWNHGFQGKLLAPYLFLKMKQTFRHADHALYVTSEFLQKRYPCKCESVAASNVKLDSLSDAVLAARIKRIQNMEPRKLTLATTAALNVRYKGQEYVIRAIPALKQAGIDVKYTLIGGGNQQRLQNLARKLGVQEQVVFAGRKPLEEVFRILDEIDIYIQPSLQEGLPRSVIEAMSRGCICVGARTAGIPELLEPEYVVGRKSVTDICKVIQKICEMGTEAKCANAARNFAEAGEYTTDILHARRTAYFEKIISDIEGRKQHP